MSLPIADLPLFAGCSAALLWASRNPLHHPGSHGFWRFFAWEAILGVIVLNRNAQGEQFISETLLLVSLLPLVLGLLALSKAGRGAGKREDEALYVWERTTTLMTDGIFSLIRHPMYAAMLALNWAMFFRAISVPGFVLALLASYWVLRTAKADERECIAYFGEPYLIYMRNSARFVPWLL
jgi:protein-S-isoprenylcysteine O-methyltransferase Ste14